MAVIEPGGEYSILERGLDSPRLGEGMDGPGQLKTAAIQRTLAVLDRIRTEFARQGIKLFRTVGTEALRLAENRGDFIVRAAGLGIEVEVISGEEEAGLIRKGSLSGLPWAEAGTVLADVGAGSSELITAGGAAAVVSLPLGCLRLRQRFSPGREPTLSDISRMEKHCRDVLDKFASEFPRTAAVVGLGGTFTTLAAIHLRLATYDGDPVHGRELSEEEIEMICLRLRGLPLHLRRRLPGLEPSRADIIVPGIVIVRAIMDRLGSGRVRVSDRGLLFGMLEDQVEAAHDQKLT